MKDAVTMMNTLVGHTMVIKIGSQCQSIEE